MLQDKLSKHDNKSEKTKFNNFSGLGIPDIFMNIMSCHEFSKSSISTVILKCCSALAPYHLSKGFVIFEAEEGGIDNIPMSVKNKSMLLIYITRKVSLHTKWQLHKLSTY